MRDKFGIRPGVRIDFVAAEGGIQLRKVVDRSKPSVLGYLKTELAGHGVKDLLDALRGEVKFPIKKNS